MARQHDDAGRLMPSEQRLPQPVPFIDQTEYLCYRFVEELPIDVGNLLDCHELMGNVIGPSFVFFTGEPTLIRAVVL
jgi:hypothetical protein